MTSEKLINEQFDNQTRWLAVTQRDVTADDQFVYAVATTGVYCRPSCPARLARPENVQFFPTCEAAEKAGFRPCRRCRPKEASLSERRQAAVQQICKLLENAEEVPSLAMLAEAMHMSPFHLHHTFKTVTGVTPRAYFAAHRARRMRKELLQSQTVTDAIYNAGYSSGSRFYSESANILGMTPTQFRRGADDVPIRFEIEPCSLGLVLVAATDTGICSILLGETKEELESSLRQMFPKAKITKADGSFSAFISQVVALIETPARGLNLPLDVRGTAFQQRVWQALRQIPSGHTMTYTEVAEQIGAPKSVRAVAHACASNPAAVAIPCHRVISKSGHPSGYRWGRERKVALLEREQAR